MNDYLAIPILSEVQSFALHGGLSGICVCASVLVAARLCQRRSQPLRYGILFGGVIGLLASPALVGVGQSIPAITTWFGVPAGADILKVPAELLPELLKRPSQDGPPAEPGPVSMLIPALGVALWVLWTLGSVRGLVRLALARLQRARALVSRPWRAGFWTPQLQAQLARQLGLRRFPGVYLSPAAPMPMVVGLWRPIIILPEQPPAAWGQAQWQAVLLHEAAHIARRDHWAVLAQRVAVLLFWWCPLVHLLSRRLNVLRENICDDFALEGPCDRIAYAELLIESAERWLSLKNLSVHLGLFDPARGGLEARITRLLEMAKRPMTKLSLPGKLLGAGFVAAACLLATAATAFSGGQPQPPKKVQIKIIVDGKEIDLSEGQLSGRLYESPKKPQAELRPLPLLGEVRVDAGQVLAQLAAAPTKPDPRIDDLVKQAEAIKPGSGADIRRALQGGARPDEPVRERSAKEDKKSVAVRVEKLAGAAANPLVRVESTPGKKIIIISIEDGKVQQLSEFDLKKLAEMGSSIVQDVVKRKAAGLYTPVQPPKPADVKADPKTIAERVTDLLAKERASRPAPAPAAPEIEALRRQLERITAELHDLRKRLDDGKK